MADSPVAAYAVQQSNGKFEAQRQAVRRSRPTASRSPRIRRSCRRPIQAALEKLIADGTYQQILKKWGVEAGAITDSEINGAIN